MQYVPNHQVQHRLQSIKSPRSVHLLELFVREEEDNVPGPHPQPGRHETLV